MVGYIAKGLTIPALGVRHRRGESFGAEKATGLIDGALKTPGPNPTEQRS